MLSQSALKKVLRYNPNTGIFNRISNGKIAGGMTSNKRYRSIYIINKSYTEHSLAFLYMTGKIPSQIDHDDQNGLNNKWKNLNKSNSLHNSKNRKAQTRNTSGFTGIYFVKNRNKWRAKIGVNNKYISLGNFSNLSDAVLARIKAEDKYGFTSLHGKII